MEIGVWSWNIEANELFWDENMFKLHGIDKDDFCGVYESWERLVHPESRDETLKELFRSLKSKEEFELTFKALGGPGESKFLGCRGKVERNAKGEAIRAYGICVDRTKAMTLNQDLEEEKIKMIHSSKLATLGEMAAGIAHEINNPLTIIGGCASIITHERMRDRPEVQKTNAQKILNAVERISKIVGGLRKFSRQSDGLERKSVCAENIVTECADLTGTKAKRAQVKIILGEIENFDLLCDEIQIQQILINLINNAIDANQGIEGSWVEISAKNGGNSSCFVVRDSGKGVPKEVADKVFHPFFTTKDVGKGTGLGLSVSQGIAREHGGEINYALMEGHTAFLLTLPHKERESSVKKVA